MPLKKKEALKDEPQEKTKNEGGKKLMDQEEVKSIATAVKGLIDQDKEKEKVSDQLTAVNRKVEKTATGLEELRKLFCSPDGTICFPTQEQLDAYLKANDEKIGKIGTMLTEVVEKVNNMKPPKGEAPEGLTPLEPMTEEKRKVSTERDNLARDEQVDGIVKWGKLTDNDLYRRISRDRNNITNIAKKGDIRTEVFDTMSDEERKKVVLFSCKDGVCKPFREGMEKEEGVKFYVKDKEGRFIPADEPQKKPLIF